MYQALYRKYRPRVFDDVVGQSHITETLKNQLVSGRLSHAYLFTGTRGTGKTTCAKILARAVNCENPQNGSPCNVCPACIGIENGSIPDVLEIDAASNNGVDNIRALRDDSIYSPATVKKRVYIIDEVHMLSTSAFNALLKIMEEPPEHLMFILATTELNKVPATILSRCQRFSFKRIQAEDISKRLMEVAEKENIALDEAAASLLARLSDGAMRDALSLLDQCTVSGGSLTCDDIYQTLGLAGNIKTASLMYHIAKGKTGDALELFSQLYSSGKDVSALFGELCSLGRDLLVLKTSGNKAMLIGGYDDETLQKLSKAFSFESLLRCVAAFQDALAAFTRSANRRTDAELSIMRVCDPGTQGDTLAIAARLSKLEDQLEEITKNGMTVVKRQHTAEPETPTVEPTAPKPAAPEPDEPPWDDSPPPFDDADAPPDINEAPAAVAQPPKPVKKVAPSPKANPASPSGEAKSPMASSDFWPELAKEAANKVGMPAGIYLQNPEMTSGLLRGNELTVISVSPFVQASLKKDEVANLIAAAAEKHVGFVPTMRFVLKGEEAVEGDKLDKLLQTAKQFDNIKII